MLSVHLNAYKMNSYKNTYAQISKSSQINVYSLQNFCIVFARRLREMDHKYNSHTKEFEFEFEFVKLFI